MKALKITAIGLLALVAAGCARTGPAGMAEATRTTFSQINPAVPEGWTRQMRASGVLVFKCPDTRCKDQGEIAYSEMLQPNLEANMRNSMAHSPNALRESGNAMASMSGGMLRQISFKDMSDQNMIRFERVMTKKTNHGNDYYITYRTIKANQSRIVSATGPTLAKARNYLKIGLDSFPQ